MEEQVFAVVRKPVNRHQKKMLDKENGVLTQWVNKVVIPMEESFTEELNSSEKSYYDLFIEYCKKFEFNARKLMHKYTFYFHQVNRYYFFETYKPLEK
jgi:hypothetical protein